jgi:regulator of protease activity HflC (stomatin/prohibitin superfamily)
MSGQKHSNPPESLIDVLSEQVAREEAMLDRIREAHGRKDAKLVMKLLGEFFAYSVEKGTGSDE